MDDSNVNDDSSINLYEKGENIIIPSHNKILLSKGASTNKSQTGNKIHSLEAK